MKAKKYEYHGNYADRAAATKKQTEVNGMVRERKIEGKPRYFVISLKPESK